MSVMYLLAECMSVLDHYFTSKSFAAVHEAFSSVYPDREAANKTTVVY
jgi:hypothetical protein